MRGTLIILGLMCVGLITLYLQAWTRYWRQERLLKDLEYWERQEARRKGYQE